MADFRLPVHQHQVKVNGRDYLSDGRGMFVVTNAADITEFQKLGAIRDGGVASVPEWSDATGTALVRPDGSQVSTLTRRNNQATVIPFGDSITVSSSAESVSGYWRLGKGHSEEAIRLAGPKLRFIRNAGVGGDTAAEALARLSSDVLDYSPDIVLIQLGTNDIVSGMTNAAIAAMMDAMETIVLRCLIAGAVPVISTPPPKDLYATEAKKTIPFFYSLARYYGVPLFDLYRYAVDPADATFKTGYAADGIHPDPACVAVVAPLLAQTLLTLPPCAAYTASVNESTAGNPANLLRNGCWEGGSFAGWSTAGATRTAETPDSAYWTGSTQRLVTTAAAFANIANSAGVTGWVEGDVLEFSGRLKASDMTVASAGGIDLQMASTSGTTWSIRPFSAHPFNGDYQFCMRTAPLLAGTGSVLVGLYARDNAMTVDMNNLTVTNVTAMETIWAPGQQ